MAREEQRRLTLGVGRFTGPRPTPLARSESGLSRLGDRRPAETVGREVSPLRSQALPCSRGVGVDRESEAQAAAAQAGTDGTAFAVEHDDMAPKIPRPAPPGRQGRQRPVVERRDLPCVEQQVEVSAVDRLEETAA
jgi:hypothetical protein